MSGFAGVNWAGNIAFEAHAYREPRSIDEMCSLVADAAEQGDSIRVVGAGHSFNEIANTCGSQLNLGHLPRIIDICEDAVTVDGGATYAQVNAALAKRGLALANLASLPHITVAGVIATATHGSRFTQPTLANAVRAKPRASDSFSQGFAPGVGMLSPSTSPGGVFRNTWTEQYLPG